ncbi:3-methyl-2-oxobutanoate hydroxymethyltransferase [Enterococcus avium]|uniref:3-methyl-2-oxobutanoate hydroxymethyltransferase n=1 Tax=Enterococcus avium TaxID=33945 RepID=UPI002A910B11|nr:3-methyl-2-oxobutanoate hydroxymethyltransferase [Enterococcus avium]MDY6442653.1 3-methyl-2-oxobutanoate hydroxymethyltransferase [Enterococcus avium]MDY6448476.1 3-methyl-2-oxobutanoate hydroxymethyltransferase [Enterococcus avium]MDY6454979.1 3-methyl-2-oxobutanoate hydroxymethyltransferase [Enterococcus avium]MDY6474971.1 3-methyl-2-oxobutanoate hydroxymethyltransferase [Enterococcus avium]
MKNTVLTMQKQKEQGEKISMLTAYDYSTAKLMDQAGINSLLVGDSLGMVMLGYEDTLSVTMEDMIHHSRAVANGAQNALVVTDLPFMSYHISIPEAVANAGRLIKEGHSAAVKLEGGEAFSKTIQAITRASIPVMGHIGLTPQSIHAFGGFKVQGKTIEAAQKILQDALAVEKAGAFAIVLEAIPADLAALITKKLTIPTIGIGAGNQTDGQLLVYQDMLGMYGEMQPKFVKRYADLGAEMNSAIQHYKTEIQQEQFPAAEHTFCIAPEIIAALEKGIKH